MNRGDGPLVARLATMNRELVAKLATVAGARGASATSASGGASSGAGGAGGGGANSGAGRARAVGGGAAEAGFRGAGSEWSSHVVRGSEKQQSDGSIQRVIIPTWHLHHPGTGEDLLGLWTCHPRGTSTTTLVAGGAECRNSNSHRRKTVDIQIVSEHFPRNCSRRYSLRTP